MVKRSLFASLLAVPVLLLTSSAQATPITGTANIAGNVTVTGNAITFNPTFTSTAGGMETGDFSGLISGTILSLTNGPATGNVSVPDFATFSVGTATPVFFDLTYIAPGVGNVANCSTNTLGAGCTPAGSPFTLFQLTSNTVLASLQLNGNSYTGTSADGVSSTTSIFSTQTVNGTVSSVIAQLQAGQAISGITYSATFVASNAPEPASMLLMGCGLLGAGLIARRKTRA